MELTTSDVLSAATVNELQDLIQINIDSRDGYQKASESIEDILMKSTFEHLAKIRDDQAEELAVFVAWTGSHPRQEGSISAALHRIWMGIVETVSSDNRHAILCEAERGEDSIKSAYESAINRVFGSAVDDVLVRHYEAVLNAHDRIRDLRDQYRTT